jgi:hypothetical protein
VDCCAGLACTDSSLATCTQSSGCTCKVVLN